MITKAINPHRSVRSGSGDENSSHPPDPLTVDGRQIVVVAQSVQPSESQTTVTRDRGQGARSGDTIVFPIDFNITYLRPFLAAIYRS
ncbi:MAG: hypothetical protein WA184_23425, partial [Stellaceae bacterium]